ncbi:type III-B CRISPR module-associated Cmr3 family protein [uncultured Cyclobacterium sp.]|uniref:type III-B CRISPR module-associated Cmr3 family protein n=1 Tax=uncultured Cyclobacterium sp. TaxID=453820 RepID=UPI0030EDEB04
MTKYNYKISLRPLENYFFGGEQTFGDKSDNEKRNYLAFSNAYPQQTSLFGLLRYLLLENNGLLPLESHREEANKLIGAASFNSSKPGEVQNFGLIENISPLFMQNENVMFRFVHGLNKMKVNFENGGDSLTQILSSNSYPQIQDYDPKKYYPDYIENAKGDLIHYHHCVFKENEQIGILKNSPKEGFFKQNYRSLAEGFSFVFYASLKNDDISFKLQDSLVFFGGEQKMFQVRVIKDPKDFPNQLYGAPESNKTTLLSDAYIPESAMHHCNFALAEIQEFRTVIFQPNGHRYFRKSQKINLLKRGSILFSSDKNKLHSILDQYPNYSQLGFNHYY